MKHTTFEPGTRIYCSCESVYAPGLQHGEPYDVFAYDLSKAQVRIKNSQGKKRWYRTYCFSLTPPVKLVSWELDDPLDQPFCEVSLCLSDGQRRWCTFALAEDFKHAGDFLDPELTVRWHSPSNHTFVLECRTKHTIELALRHTERQGRILEHTVSLAPEELLPSKPDSPA